MTALIGVAIIGIWLIVLVPMWLNRHDAADANRSMDSFSTAMRVLSRRAPSQGDRRYVVMPRRDNWGVTVDNNPNAKIGRRSPRLRRPAPTSPAARARVMTRRRRVTLGVLGLALTLMLTAALGVTSWWYELAILLASAGYLIHLRGEAIRARELRRRRTARARRAASWTPTDEAYRRPPASSEQISDDVQVLPAPATSAASASGTTREGGRWEPVPVPLPTYVSKPVVARASAPVPRADVDATRYDSPTWSDDVEIDHRYLLLDDTGSGRISASAGAPPAPGTRRPSIELEDDELDVILERRRAVGD